MNCHQITRFTSSLCLVSLAATFVLACGDDDEANDTQPEPSAAVITAAEGGTVSTTGASLAVPAGALAEDTEITVQAIEAGQLPDAGSIGSNVYQFGPSGLHFNSPATLEVTLTSTSPQEGAQPVLARLDGAAWTPLAGSSQSGQKVSAPVSHFSTFAVIWRSTGQVDECDATPFDACGGDIVGTWTFADTCAKLEAVGDPFGGTCADFGVEYDVTLSGTVTFDADGTATWDALATTTKRTYYSTTCGGCNPDASPPFEQVGNQCVQVQPIEVNRAHAHPYETDGGDLDVNPGSGQPPNQYCVDGDTLRWRDENGAGVAIYTMTRVN